MWCSRVSVVITNRISRALVAGIVFGLVCIAVIWCAAPRARAESSELMHAVAMVRWYDDATWYNIRCYEPHWVSPGASEEPVLCVVSSPGLVAECWAEQNEEGTLEFIGCHQVKP